MQELEENLRETQATAQRLETHLKQKEKLYEDKIKVRLHNAQHKHTHTYAESFLRCKTTGTNRYTLMKLQDVFSGHAVAL